MPAVAEVLVLVPEPSYHPVEAHSEVWGQCERNGAHLRGQAAYYVRIAGGIRLDVDVDLLTDTFAVELRAGDGETIFSVAKTRELTGSAMSSTVAVGSIPPRHFPAILEGAVEAIRLLLDAVGVECESDRARIVDAAARIQRAVIRSAAGVLMAIDDDVWDAEEDGELRGFGRRAGALARLGRAGARRSGAC